MPLLLVRTPHATLSPCPLWFVKHPFHRQRPCIKVTASSPHETLPTMYDLPSEELEEPGLPDQFHIYQPRLLEETFRPPSHPTNKVFVATDLNLYYDPRHTRWYKRPDWFAVLGVSRLYAGEELRWSYVIWQEGVNPFLVLELLSPGTFKNEFSNRAK
ncbi:MAG: hypothetical protein BRC37_05940 [Cyanobacteria bacterium QH_3_48_40]|nr:MAG: hypothetical protein BRC37_05940 [Cyanobacteria bacterium QH_3_48_40]